MAEPELLPLMTTTAYAEREGLEREVLHPAARAPSADPLRLPAEGADDGTGDETSYVFPEVTLTAFRNMAVRGASNFLTARDAILTHDLLDLHRDMPPEFAHRRLAITRNRRLAAWENAPSSSADVPEAAVFTDHTALNYAHWLTEVLPRIAAFVRDPAARRTPLLLDVGLHDNLVRSIGLLAREGVMLRLRADGVARVGVSHHVSVAGYVPYSQWPRDDMRMSGHGRFSPPALREMVRELRSVVPHSSGDAPPNVFVRRTSRSRRLLNESDIEAALVARGFVAVEPEKLSFEEQVRLYGQARLVVGASGAAMANLIFCQPDCTAVVLVPRFAHLAHRYWNNMALAAGAGRVIHVTGPQETVHEDPRSALAPHQNFTVELTDVLAGLDAALAFSG